MFKLKKLNKRERMLRKSSWQSWKLLEKVKFSLFYLNTKELIRLTDKKIILSKLFQILSRVRKKLF